MKQFAAIAFAAFAGVLAALLVYYLVVTKPGIENEFSRVDKARAAAQEVGRELEKAADASVAHVREGFESQAREERHRALAATAFAAGQSAKVAITESYMTMGRLPASPEEIGWGAPADYASGGARGVAIEPDGVVRIDLVDALAPGASIRLIPTVSSNTGILKWLCEVEGYPALLRLAPDCKPSSGDPAAEMSGKEVARGKPSVSH